jgi:hypothetical protein
MNNMGTDQHLAERPSDLVGLIRPKHGIAKAIPLEVSAASKSTQPRRIRDRRPA